MFVPYSQTYAARALPILFNTPQKIPTQIKLPKKILAWHMVVIPSSRGIFVYKLVTSIETRIGFRGTLVPSMKLINCVVSLMYDCNITVQNKTIAKTLPVNKFTTLKFLSLLPSMNINGIFFLDYYWAAFAPSHKMGFRSSAAKNGLPGEGRHEGLVPRNDVLTNGFI